MPPSPPAPTPMDQAEPILPSAAEHAPARIELPAVTGGELPEAYGTGRVGLVARDPHWLYAHWDWSRAQLRELSGYAQENHLTLRVHREHAQGLPFCEVPLDREANNWFVHVGCGGCVFLAELGYYVKGAGRWQSLGFSNTVRTPPDTASRDVSVQFIERPSQAPERHVLALIHRALHDHVPLAEVFAQLQAGGTRALAGQLAPTPAIHTAAAWEPLARLSGMTEVRRQWINSQDLVDWAAHGVTPPPPLAATTPDAAGAEAPGPSLAPAPARPPAVTSFMEVAPAPPTRRFWFRINAEVIVHGATEPDACVTIGGRPIRLQPDGTFRFHFLLPDGDHALALAATSAAGDDVREARLDFRRATLRTGVVGVNPCDPALRPPAAESIA